MYGGAGTREGERMNIDEKLDLILVRLDGIDTRLDGVDARFDEMQGNMDGINHRLDEMQDNMDGINHRLDEMQGSIDAINLRLENEIHRDIMRIAEGHQDLERKLDAAIKPHSEFEMLSIRVSWLETKVNKMSKKRKTNK